MLDLRSLEQPGKSNKTKMCRRKRRRGKEGKSEGRKEGRKDEVCENLVNEKKESNK